MSNGRILLVEDNSDNLMLVQDFIEALGYQVVIAPDGQAGVQFATSEKPDLILLDMSLPVMDGWHAARQIKDNATTSTIPIIALTAHAMLGDRERALEAGCDDYLSKPIDFVALRQKITALLRVR
jgi:two-component system, cell cycle response regulator DivK